MSSSAQRRERADRAFLLGIFFEGPWERLENFFYGLRPDHTLRWDIPEHPGGWRAVLAWLADYCGRRDIAWRGRLAEQRREPHPRWKRRI